MAQKWYDEVGDPVTPPPAPGQPPAPPRPWWETQTSPPPQQFQQPPQEQEQPFYGVIPPTYYGNARPPGYNGQGSYQPQPPPQPWIPNPYRPWETAGHYTQVVTDSARQNLPRMGDPIEQARRVAESLVRGLRPLSDMRNAVNAIPGQLANDLSGYRVGWVPPTFALPETGKSNTGGFTFGYVPPTTPAPGADVDQQAPPNRQPQRKADVQPGQEQPYYGVVPYQQNQRYPLTAQQQALQAGRYQVPGMPADYLPNLMTYAKYFQGQVERAKWIERAQAAKDTAARAKATANSSYGAYRNWEDSYDPYGQPNRPYAVVKPPPTAAPGGYGGGGYVAPGSGGYGYGGGGYSPSTQPVRFYLNPLLWRI